MELVQQKHCNGCGLACIAMLAETSYDEVLQRAQELFGEFETNDDFLTEPEHLRCLAKSYEFRIGNRVKFKTEDGRSVVNFAKDMTGRNIRCHAILAVNLRKNCKWHWIVWDHENNRILDPKIKPYKMIRPWYYLKVSCP